MNAISKISIDLSTSHNFKTILNRGKYIYIAKIDSTAFLSFTTSTDTYGLIDLTKIRELYIPEGFNKFYITNPAGNGTLELIVADCGLYFDDYLDIAELKTIIEEINSTYRSVGL